MAGGVSGAISVWPTENGNLGPSARQSWIAHRGSVQSLLWSPDGARLISAGGDGQITTWTLESAVQDEPRQFRTDFQHRFCLIPGTPLMVGVHAPPRTLILWDWKRGRHTSVGGYLPFDDAAPAPDGRFFAIIRRRHEVLTYEVPPNGEFQDNVHPVGIWQPGIWIEQVKVAPDSQTVAAVFRQNEIAQPADSAGVMLLKTPGLEVARTISFPGARRVAFAPSGNRLAISNGTTLALFDARGAVWSQPQAATDVLEFSPDGALIASVGSDQAVWIRSAATGQLVQSLTGNGGPIRTVAFSPDGKTLATGGYDGAIILWHVPGLRELFKLRGPGGSCVQLAFSSDSRHLVSLIHTDPTIFGVIQTFNAPEDDRAP
jgi:WD40 repeat protein